jgi:hypothetical protein
MIGEIYKMFDGLSNKELRMLIVDVRSKVLKGLLEEVFDQERSGHASRESQYKFLNRLDLLYIIYGLLAPEIRLIDETPMDDVPLLINHEWSCPQLTERVKRRLRIGK